MMNSRHTFTAKLVSNGDYQNYIRDGRCHSPEAKRQLGESYDTEDEALKVAESEWADRDELDHIVTIEFDENFNFVSGSY